MQLPLVTAQELARLLPMDAAIDALQEAFAASDLPEAPLRTRLDTRGGELLVMPAAGTQGVGVKLVTLNPSNPARGLPFIHAVYVLFAAGTLKPVAVIDGGALTALRTAAVSGLATRWLAREDASTLVIFGAGVQAHSHLEAMVAVRPVRDAVVVSRTAKRAEGLAARARSLGLRARTGRAEDAGEGDVICTCTTSAEPVFDGDLLQPGAHVNAVGAYRPDLRELDERAVSRGRLVVETREAALSEAGDLLIPIEAGVISADNVVADLSEVVRGRAVRMGPEDVTVFKSVGLAFEDLAVARAIADRMAA